MLEKPKRKISRRRFLRGLGGCAALGAGGLAYMRYVEPGWLKPVEWTLRLPHRGLRNHMRIAHLSDFHASRVVPFSLLERAVEMTLAMRPDLVCFTGDFITRKLDEPDRYAALLRRVSAAAPTFAVTGNHDGGAWIASRGGYPDTSTVQGLLEDAVIPCLNNRAVTLEIGHQPIRLVGLGDLWAREFMPDTAFSSGNDAAIPTLVMSHNPDTKQYLLDYRWDLMLCGHTHGGQLSLPMIGTPFAPVQDHRYVHGLKAWRDRWIHVTSGVGNIRGMRLHCRPEVSLLKVEGAA